jgi:hypothetical protein
MRDLTAERETALNYAVDLHRNRFGSHSDDNDKVLATATALFNWIIGAVALSIEYGLVLDQNTGQPTGTQTGGTPVQLHDTEQVDLTVRVLDVKGAVITDDPETTSDDLAWVINDENVATLSISADTRTCTVVAGLPRSVP